MKRSEALEQIRKILELNRIDNGMGEVEEAILHTLESIGMFYCPVEKFGELGTLRTPKGWDDE